METDIRTQLLRQQEKIDKIYISVEKTRKYFLIMMWSTIIMFALPFLVAAFIIPTFLNMYLGSFDGLL